MHSSPDVVRNRARLLRVHALISAALEEFRQIDRADQGLIADHHNWEGSLPRCLMAGEQAASELLGIDSAASALPANAFSSTAGAQGWSEGTQMALLQRFIEEHRLEAAFNQFAADVAAEECDLALASDDCTP